MKFSIYLNRRVFLMISGQRRSWQVWMCRLIWVIVSSDGTKAFFSRRTFKMLSIIFAIIIRLDFCCHFNATFLLNFSVHTYFYLTLMNTSIYSTILTFTTLGLIQQTTNWWYFVLFSRKRVWHSMQIVLTGDNLHTMSKPVFWENIFKCRLLNFFYRES